MYLQSSISDCSVEECLDIKYDMPVIQQRRYVQALELPVGDCEDCRIELAIGKLIRHLNAVFMHDCLRIGPRIIYCHIHIVLPQRLVDVDDLRVAHVPSRAPGCPFSASAL